MQSNLSKAKDSYETLLALAETNHFLSQIMACETNEEVKLDDVARDGLSNIFYMLAKECEKTLELMDMEGNGYQKGGK